VEGEEVWGAMAAACQASRQCTSVDRDDVGSGGVADWHGQT